MITDLAEIGYAVDTAGLERGEAALDRFDGANKKVASSSKQVEATNKSVEKSTTGLGSAVGKASNEWQEYTGVHAGVKKGLEETASKSEQAAKGTGILSKGLGMASGAALKLATALGTLVGSFLSGAFFASATAEAEKFQTTMFRIEAVIKATGGVAQRSAEQLREQARNIAWSTLESTEGVLQAQQTLLTFRQIQGDTFDRTIKAAADMSQALGGDLNSATMQLAKALENPINGLSALSRSGTVFTDQQKEMVKGMVEAGNMAGAQAFILSELEAQYGGTAEAAAQGAAGIRDTMGQALQELKLEIAETMGLMQAKNAVIKGLTVVFLALTGAIEPMRGYLIAAAVGLTAFYTPAILSATVATGAFILSLITMKGALLASGIGVFIVLAGTLVNWLLKLSEKAGGFGEALGLLGDVGVEAFGRMGTAGQALWNFLQGAAAGISAAFLSSFGAIATGWDRLVNGMAAAWNMLADSGLGDTLGLGRMQESDLSGKIDAGVAALYAKSAAAFDRATEAYGKLTEPMASVERLREVMAGSADETDNAAAAAAGLETALTGAGEAGETAGGKAGGAAKKAKEETEKAAKAAHEWASALENELTSAIDSSAKAFGDWVVRMGSDWKSMVGSMIDSFKSMLSNMIAMAAKNRIMISMGMDPLSKSLSAAGVGGLPQGGGMLGAAVGTWGGAGGLLGGLSGVGAGASAGMASGGLLGGLSGGLSASMGGISAGLSAGGIAGISAAIGAALPIIAGVAAVFKIGKALFGRKLKDTGIEATFDMAEGLAARTYKFYKGGLLRSNKTRYEDMGADMDPVGQAFRGVGESVIGFADQLGLQAERINSFDFGFKFSTKGMSEQDIQARFQEELERYGSAAADAVAGGMLARFKQTGETSLETLERLATHLTNFNVVMGRLGLQVQRVGLAGANAASEFVQLFGGLDQFNQAASFYYDNFYTLAEKQANAQRDVAAVMGSLGVNQLPQTEAQFRALVDQFDRVGNTQGVATLMQLAPQFIELMRLSEELAGVNLPDPAILREREDLERRLAVAQGNTAFLRAKELEALHASNRPLLRQIWAAERAAEVAQERTGLEEQLLGLQGNTAALRQRELEQLDPSNRALQRRIWAMQEEQRVAEERQGLEQRLLSARGDTDALRRLELESLDASNRSLLRSIWATEAANKVAEERRGLEESLMQAMGDVAGLRRLELERLDATNRALQERIWAEEKAAAIAKEREGLDRRVLEAQGNTAALRALDLATLDASNRALQTRIWALEDERRVTDERAGLEKELQQVLGNTAWLRAKELDGLNASNRALQLQIWAIGDAEQAYTAARSAAEQAASAERSRIASMRATADATRALSAQAMQATADTSEAQRKAAERQLRVALETGRVWDDSLGDLAKRAAAVDASNFSSYTAFLSASAQAAALLESVAQAQEAEAVTAEARLEQALERYGLSEAVVESLDQALRKLDQTLLQLAMAQEGAGAPQFMQGTGGTPAQLSTAPVVAAQAQGVQDGGVFGQLLDEVKQLRADNKQGHAQIAKNTKASVDIARKWDIDGMPNIRELIS